MNATTERERVVELIREKTIVPAAVARNDAEVERVMAELADAVLAALAVPATVTDEMVLRALNAYSPHAATEDITDWSVGKVERMRSALESALSAVPATGEVEPEHRCEFYPYRDVMQCVCGNREVTP